MLSLQILSPKMAAHYYAKEDYYSKDNLQMKSEFHGKIAEEFGLKGKEVDTNSFNNFLIGKDIEGNSLLKRKEYFLDKQSLEPLVNAIENIEDEKIRYKLYKAIDKNYSLKKDSSFYKTYKKNGKISSEFLDTIESKLIRQNGSEDEKSLKKLYKNKIKDENKIKELDSSVRNICKNRIRAGIDATFSAPKKISIKALVEGDKDLQNAHKEAVKWSVNQIEEMATYTRTGSKKDRKEVQTDNLLSGIFHHGTSRPVDGNAPDPNLHSHCVIMNFTKFEGKFQHFHNDELYKRSKLLGVLYQNKLAEIVQKLGYSIELKDNGTFDLVGYNNKIVDHFSKRRNQTKDASAKFLFTQFLEEDLNNKGIKTKKIESNNEIKFKIIEPKSSMKLDKYRTIKDKNGSIYITDFNDSNSFEFKKKELLKQVTQKTNRIGVPDIRQ